MPEEAASAPSEPTKKEVSPNTSEKNTPETVTFKKSKFIIFSVLGLLMVLAALTVSYFLGQDSAKEEVVAQKEGTQEKKEEIPDVVEAKLGEEAKAKNGIAIELEEAKHHTAYEKQKEESKKYYEKNASQSAYLNSEYFKQSSLVLKISVKNTTDKVAYYTPSSFRLKDSRDNQYTSGYGYEGGAPQTNTYTLNPSETTKLSVSYIVPTSEKNFTLVYENVVIEFSL